MSFSNQNDDDVQSEMNVTPLVDVMLVLLIVFIVTTPLMTNAVQVNLPETQAMAPPDADEPMELSVDIDGNYYIGEEQYEYEAMEAELRRIQKGNPEQIVHLQADEGVNYGQVARAMAALERSGISRVAVLTQQ